ncbi:hypothetical protein M569_08696, partial [Genlisea aurea]
DRSEIVFFDVETTVPARQGQGFAILEFGAILVCPRRLVELRNYSTLVRPADLSHISTLSVRCNGITKEGVVSAPTFADIADMVYDLLHGRIWAGHNILKFDIARIREAFAEINRPAPEPKGTIDSLVILRQKFGRRAGDMKMASLATYFGLGQQTHRSLDDVRMNLEVVKYCATVLFLESSLPDVFTENSWISPVYLEVDDDVPVSSISAALAPTHTVYNKIRLLCRDFALKLHCSNLKIRFGISTKYADSAGRPKLNIVVDAPPSLCLVLEKADRLARDLSISSSDWRDVVNRKPGFYNSPTVRLHLQTITEGETTQIGTEIYEEGNSGRRRRVVLNQVDVVELDSLFSPGNLVDAFF